MPDPPAHSPWLALDYRHTPHCGRLVWEPRENGFKITMPPVGLWRRVRWGLLAILAILPIPVTAVAIFIGPSFFSRLQAVLAVTWHESPTAVLLLPFYPGSLILEFAVVVILLGGYFEGRRATIIDVTGDELTIIISGRYRTKNWRFFLSKCKLNAFGFGIVQIASRLGWRFVHLRYGTAAELRWVLDRLLEAQRQHLNSDAGS